MGLGIADRLKEGGRSGRSLRKMEGPPEDRADLKEITEAIKGPGNRGILGIGEYNSVGSGKQEAS
jgi:hypothetical protein